jgi:GntR family transcriptional regulator/MocR family aminotransferase
MISSRAYDRHVRRCRNEYRSRRDQVVAALPQNLTPQGISAGLHLVLPLSTSAESAIPAAARRHSLAIETLSPHWMHPNNHPGGLIVGYGAPFKHAFTGALQALQCVLREIPAQGAAR